MYNWTDHFTQRRQPVKKLLSYIPEVPRLHDVFLGKTAKGMKAALHFNNFLWKNIEMPLIGKGGGTVEVSGFYWLFCFL